MYVTVCCMLCTWFLSPAQEGSGPEVSDPAEFVATDSVANTQIGFDSDSLAATINEGAYIHTT